MKLHENPVYTSVLHTHVRVESRWKVALPLASAGLICWASPGRAEGATAFLLTHGGPTDSEMISSAAVALSTPFTAGSTVQGYYTQLCLVPRAA